MEKVKDKMCNNHKDKMRVNHCFCGTGSLGFILGKGPLTGLLLLLSFIYSQSVSHTHTSHTYTQPFYGPLDFVWDYPGKTALER